MALPWSRARERSRVFEVECECGEIFRVPFDPTEAAAKPGDQFLVSLEGRCPWCGLRLEELDPLGISDREA